jgi:hypothetical protein
MAGQVNKPKKVKPERSQASKRASAWRRVQNLLAAGDDHIRSAYEHYRDAGGELDRLRKTAEHGQWKTECAERGLKERTARDWIAIYRKRDKIEKEGWTELPINQILKRLANPRPKKEAADKPDRPDKPDKPAVTPGAPKPPITPTPPAPKPPASPMPNGAAPGGMPSQITTPMRERLTARGYLPDDIASMTPGDAHKALAINTVWRPWTHIYEDEWRPSNMVYPTHDRAHDAATVSGEAHDTFQIREEPVVEPNGAASPGAPTTGGTPTPGPTPTSTPGPEFERCEWRLWTDGPDHEKLRQEQWIAGRLTWPEVKAGIEQRAPKLPPGYHYTLFMMRPVDGAEQVEELVRIWPAIGTNTKDPGDFPKPPSEPSVDQPDEYRDYHFPGYPRAYWKECLTDEEFLVVWLSVLRDRLPDAPIEEEWHSDGQFELHITLPAATVPDAAPPVVYSKTSTEHKIGRKDGEYVIWYLDGDGKWNDDLDDRSFPSKKAAQAAINAEVARDGTAFTKDDKFGIYQWPSEPSWSIYYDGRPISHIPEGFYSQKLARHYVDAGLKTDAPPHRRFIREIRDHPEKFAFKQVGIETLVPYKKAEIVQEAAE